MNPEQSNHFGGFDSLVGCDQRILGFGDFRWILWDSTQKSVPISNTVYVQWKTPDNTSKC